MVVVVQVGLQDLVGIEVQKSYQLEPEWGDRARVEEVPKHKDWIGVTLVGMGQI
jgi:hypothetical protein